jgi:hypothetical protein
MPELTRIECLKALHCEPTATAKEIVSAYKRWRRLLHPDTKGTGDHALFIRLTEAFETLKQHFNFDLHSLTTEPQSNSDDEPTSLKTERQIQDKLKQKLKDTEQEDVLYQKIIDELLNKFELISSAECHIILLPGFASTIAIIMKDLQLKLIVKTSMVKVVQGAGSYHDGIIEFTTGNTSTPVLPEIKMTTDQFGRLLDCLAFRDFDLKFQDTNRDPSLRDLTHCWITGGLLDRNRHLSASDLLSALQIDGRRNFIKMSACREIIETHVENSITRAKLSYAQNQKRLREDNSHYERYVAAKTPEEEFFLLEDGCVYVESSPFLQNGLLTFVNTRIRDFVKDQFLLLQKQNEEDQELELAKKLRKKNQELASQIQARQNLESILGNLKRNLIGDK